jgi:hypothetical protein
LILADGSDDAFAVQLVAHPAANHTPHQCHQNQAIDITGDDALYAGDAVFLSLRLARSQRPSLDKLERTQAEIH